MEGVREKIAVILAQSTTYNHCHCNTYVVWGAVCLNILQIAVFYIPRVICMDYTYPGLPHRIYKSCTGYKSRTGYINPAGPTITHPVFRTSQKSKKTSQHFRTLRARACQRRPLNFEVQLSSQLVPEGPAGQLCSVVGLYPANAAMANSSGRSSPAANTCCAPQGSGELCVGVCFRYFVQ